METRQAQIDKKTSDLYEKVGRIVVKSEHLNNAMNMCALFILQKKGLNQQYALTVLANQNLEPMRKLSLSLLLQFYSRDEDAKNIITKLFDEIDKAIGKRNRVVHYLWHIGWGNEQMSVESYSHTEGMVINKDMKQGGYVVKKNPSRNFEEAEKQLDRLTEMIHRLVGCIAGDFKPSKNFYFDTNKKLQPSA